MKQEKEELSKEDFDLTIKYNIFDILYLVESGNIKPIIIMGYELNSSSEARCFEYIYYNYPISIYVRQNEIGKLRKYDTVYTSTADAYIAFAKIQKQLLIDKMDKIAKKLKLKE